MWSTFILPLQFDCSATIYFIYSFYNMVQLSQMLRAITLSFLVITATSKKPPKISTTVTSNPAISTSSPVGCAGFAAADSTISFTLNIPENNLNDLYFSMSGPSKASWIVSSAFSDLWARLNANTKLGCGIRKWQDENGLLDDYGILRFHRWERHHQSTPR